MSQDRRKILKLVAAASLVQGCESVTPDSAPAFFKDPSPFIQHGNVGLEAKIEEQSGFFTPVERFFVRNNDRSLDVDASTYRLEVSGNAVTNPLRLRYDDLLAMPSRAVFSYLECGGNQRRFFGTLLGRTAQGTPWGRGAVGMAEWTGVPLAEVLERAGVSEAAHSLQLIGLDSGVPEGGFRRPLPIAKALDPDTILAYRMNGEALPKDHGFPVRALVPDWVGSSSIKWLGSIEVSNQAIWSRNNTTSYVLIGEDNPPEGKASGRVATTQTIKSALALPWPAHLKAGRCRIRGYAHSPHSAIARVEWSVDSGTSWHEAAVLEPAMRHAWARFEFVWNALPGNHHLMCHRPSRQWAARHRTLQRQGVPVQHAAATSGHGNWVRPCEVPLSFQSCASRQHVHRTPFRSSRRGVRRHTWHSVSRAMNRTKALGHGSHQPSWLHV